MIKAARLVSLTSFYFADGGDDSFDIVLSSWSLGRAWLVTRVLPIHQKVTLDDSEDDENEGSNWL